MSDFEKEHICGICFQKSRYVCPRCGISYCSLTCYRDAKHQDCSESFYRDCCLDSMRNSFVGDDQKAKMLEILRREANASAQPENQELDSDDDTGERDTDSNGGDGDNILDSRFANLKLETEDVSPDLLWSLLTPKERREFNRLLQSGKLAELIPIWNPWWREQELVVPVTSDSQNVNKAPPVRSLKYLLPSGKTPHFSVGYMLIDILLGYVSTCRRYNGDHFDLLSESTVYLMDIVASFCPWTSKSKSSTAHPSNQSNDQSKTRIITPTQQTSGCQTFESVSQVLGSVQSRLMQSNLPCSPSLMTILLEDVGFLLAKPNKCARALRDCHKLVTQFKKFPDLDPSLVDKVKVAHHKLTFLRACLNPKDPEAVAWQSLALPKLRNQLDFCLCQQLGDQDQYAINPPSRIHRGAGPNWRSIIRDSRNSNFESDSHKPLIQTLPDP